MRNERDSTLADELLEVRRTLGWMDLVIGNISDAVYVSDKKSRLIFVNQYFSDLLNIPRVFLLGRQLDEVFVTSEIKDEKGDVPGNQAEQSATLKEQVGTFKWLDQNAKQYIFRISRRRLSTTGQTVYLARNITQEYEISRMKTSFIDLASHQLRTPMTAIMTYTHMLHDGFGGKLSKGQEELSATILQASERMISLVNDLLTITRIQNCKDIVLRQAVSLDSILQKIDAELQSRIAEKQLRFEIVVAPDAPKIVTNEAMLHEILSNLIVNAVQYTPTGGKIRAVVTDSRKQVSIAISDNGIGIPADYLPNVFEQFSRADNALAVYPEGTGLGLYVIKILLDRIGGTIECRSTVNKGTTFTVRLKPQ
jgi:signal transduction histidine kinase